MYSEVFSWKVLPGEQRSRCSHAWPWRKMHNSHQPKISLLQSCSKITQHYMTLVFQPLYPMSQDTGLTGNSCDCISRMYLVGLAHRWLYKGKVENANHFFLSSSQALSDSHFIWKDKEDQTASWERPRWGTEKPLVKTHRTLKKSILKFKHDSNYQRGFPFAQNNSPNPCPSHGVCKRNIFVKIIPVTHSSRVIADVISYTLTLSVCAQIWAPPWRLLQVALGHPSNNHPVTVKNRCSLMGQVPWAECSGLRLRASQSLPCEGPGKINTLTNPRYTIQIGSAMKEKNTHTQSSQLQNHLRYCVCPSQKSIIQSPTGEQCHENIS